jgi:hypothetical protein
MRDGSSTSQVSTHEPDVAAAVRLLLSRTAPGGQRGFLSRNEASGDPEFVYIVRGKEARTHLDLLADKHRRSWPRRQAWSGRSARGDSRYLGFDKGVSRSMEPSNCQRGFGASPVDVWTWKNPLTSCGPSPSATYRPSGVTSS